MSQNFATEDTNDFLQNWLENRYGENVASEMMQDIRADLDTMKLQESANKLLKTLEELHATNDNFNCSTVATHDIYSIIMDQV